MVRTRRIEKFEVSAQALVLYLRRLVPGANLSLPLPLIAERPGQVQLPAPHLYEYYQPERAAFGRPQLLRVQEPRPQRPTPTR